MLIIPIILIFQMPPSTNCAKIFLKITRTKGEQRCQPAITPVPAPAPPIVSVTANAVTVSPTIGTRDSFPDASSAQRGKPSTTEAFQYF